MATGRFPTELARAVPRPSPIKSLLGAYALPVSDPRSGPGNKGLFGLHDQAATPFPDQPNLGKKVIRPLGFVTFALRR